MGRLKKRVYKIPLFVYNFEDAIRLMHKLFEMLKKINLLSMFAH